MLAVVAFNKYKYVCSLAIIVEDFRKIAEVNEIIN